MTTMWRIRGAWGAVAPLVLLALHALSSPAGASPAFAFALAPQDTIPRDTIPRDTIPRDTIPLDSLALDTIPGDTLPEPRPVRNLRDLPTPVPAGWSTGIWEWDRVALLSSRALSLLELLELIPGVTALRGGDYGQPATVTAFGLGPGRVRIYLDGAELAPLDGGVVDLAQVGIGGLDRVRVERRMGELRVDLTGLRLTDSRVYSLLEVGTGDLGTNIFRGTLAHPNAFGGNAVLALDRIDTEGPDRDETGVSSGVHLRYDYFPGEATALSAEWRRMMARRPEGLWAPAQVTRTDWSLRARREILEGMTAELFFHSGSLGLDEEQSGPGADTLVSTDARRELGARVGWERDQWWSEAELRRRTGEGWPTNRAGVRGGGSLPGIGGASAGADWEGWDDDSAVNLHARVWTEPFLGISLFGEVEDGRRGVPVRVPLSAEPEEEGEENGEDPVEPEPEADPFAPSFSDRTGVRVGAEYRRGGFMLGAAALAMRADSLFPTGVGRERSALALGAAERTGFEVSTRLPLSRLLDGLAFVGSTQMWGESVSTRSLPNQSYEARFSFHNIYYPTGNLEIWSDLGVAGREDMAIPFLAPGGEALQTVPFRQSWFVRLQIRVLDVHVFVEWENFTLRDANQDYPGRILPTTRSLYGVRWTLWN